MLEELVIPLFSYIIGGIISGVIAAILLTKYKDWREKRKREKELKKEFLALYDAFRNNQLHKIMILIKRIGMEKIEDLLLGVGQIWFDPVKKKIEMEISGKSTKSDYVKYEGDLEKYQDLKEDAKNSITEYDVKVKSYQYITNRDFQSMRIRLDTKSRMIILGTIGRQFYIFETDKDNSKKYNGFNHPKNKEILISFLNYMEKRFLEKGIIDDFTKLNKETVSWKNPRYDEK